MVPSRIPSINPPIEVIGVFSSWGDVGDKAAAQSIPCWERDWAMLLRAIAQLAHLVVGGDLNPGGEVPLAEFLSGGRHLPQRPDHLDGRVVGDDHRQNPHPPPPRGGNILIISVRKAESSLLGSAMKI